MIVRLQITDYCREIEAYLCQKNDGHLIRVVGPSFDLVSRWAADGVPLKVAYRGIDRYFERYYRKGPRRRPVRIDFCEADVLDVFDEWRRAVGLVGVGSGSDPSDAADGVRSGSDPDVRPTTSLPAHLERVLLRLSEARARGSLGAAFDAIIDRVAGELDAVRSEARGLRGAARRGVLDRLVALDAEILEAARLSLDGSTTAGLAREAEAELAPFREAMAPEQFARALAAATDRLIRERLRLPTLSYT